MTASPASPASPLSPEPNGPSWAEVLTLLERLDGAPYEDVQIEMPGLSVRMSRHGFAVAAPGPVRDAPPAAPAGPPATAREPITAGGPDAAPGGEPAGVQITASMLGVVYCRPTPDQDPFVSVGDTVEPATTVAIIEVMKMMNQVEAGVGGRVTEILFADGDTVEFGQPLFLIEPEAGT